jgi:endonuclease YncB( thermonuclease family)
MRRTTLVVLAWLLAPIVCLGASLSGTVSEVTDGDTITVSGRSVRLQGIDAPERGQPHGQAATEALRAAVLDERVRLELRGNDRYGRLIAVVYRDDRNINRWLVRQGHAWEYDRYSDDPAMVRLEKAARADDRGVWAGDSPVPPWEWRQGHPRPQGGESAEPDRDCLDFSSQRSAQRFFEANRPGDPHRLDGDGDGVACESLP